MCLTLFHRKNRRAELERLLNAIGLKVNFFSQLSHPDSFRKITRAALNVSLCATHDDYFLKYLKERYDMPFIIGNFPIGIEKYREWLLDIAANLTAKKRLRSYQGRSRSYTKRNWEVPRETEREARAHYRREKIRVPVTADAVKELAQKSLVYADIITMNSAIRSMQSWLLTIRILKWT